jgi:hypothetical protein
VADVPASDLVNSAQIAERLGIAHRESVVKWRQRHPEFPEPALHVGKVMLWSWPEVRAWAERTGRIAGGSAQH